jgi:hypothetical protein
MKLKGINKKMAQKPGQPAAPNSPQAAITGAARRIGGGLFGGRPKPQSNRFGGLRNMISNQIASKLPKPPAVQAPGKPLGQAQPLQASQPEQPAQSPSVPFKESIVQQPEPAAPAQPEAPAPQPAAPATLPAPAAPQEVRPAAQMQQQQNQMYQQAPTQAAPAAGGVKSQAEIEEEKKKQMAMNPA